MPEQIKISVEKRVFCAGLLSFCLGTCVLLQNYHGLFPRLIPVFLIFFAALAAGSFSGHLSGKKYIHFLFLLIFSGLLLYFKDSFLFVLIGGFSAGMFSADAFSGISEKHHWHFTIRDYLTGGLFGIVLAGNSFFEPWYSVPAALFLYAISVFFWKSESKRSAFIYGILFLISVAAIFYFTEFYNLKDRSEPVKESVSVPEVETEDDELSLRHINVLSLVHFPLNRMLFILPEDSSEKKLSGAFGSEHTVLYYGRHFGIHDQLAKNTGKYDLIIVEYSRNEFSMFSHQFIGALKGKLTPHGVLICHLSNNDLFSAGGLRASLQKNFRFTRAGRGIASLAASDQPLILNRKITTMDVLEPVIYSKDWDFMTRSVARTLPAPSDSDYMFERTVLLRDETNPVHLKYYRFFPLSPLVYSIVLASLFILYFVIRYLAAYIDGMGLRLTVFQISLFFFFTAGYQFFSKTLNSSPGGVFICAALLFLLPGCISGCYISTKYSYLGMPGFLLLFVLSWFLMPYIGILFTAGVFARCFLCGCIFPMLLRRSAEKYKTGTVEPAEMFSSVCSGLAAAVMLLAMMP